MSFLLHGSGSVGAPGEQSPGATRPVSAPLCPKGSQWLCGTPGFSARNDGQGPRRATQSLTRRETVDTNRTSNIRQWIYQICRSHVSRA